MNLNIKQTTLETHTDQIDLTLFDTPTVQDYTLDR